MKNLLKKIKEQDLLELLALDVLMAASALYVVLSVMKLCGIETIFGLVI